MQIDWWTLAIQAVNFLVLVWLLNRVLYRPVKAVIDKRQAMSEHALKDAADQIRATQSERAKLVARQAEIEATRQQDLSEFHDSLEHERQEVLRKANDTATQTIEKARADAEVERNKILDKLKPDIAGLAADMAGKIMSGEVGAHSASPDPQRVEAALKEMPAEKIGQLTKSIQAGDPGIVVVTAAPLDDAEKPAWTAMLVRIFGRAAEPVFDVDPSILGGVNVRFPNSELSLSWAHYLKDAKNMLTGGHGDT